MRENPGNLLAYPVITSIMLRGVLASRLRAVYARRVKRVGLPLEIGEGLTHTNGERGSLGMILLPYLFDCLNVSEFVPCYFWRGLGTAERHSTTFLCCTLKTRRGS